MPTFRRVVSDESETFTAVEREAMALCLREALRGTPSPNPHVGAVVVRDGKIVSSGWHRRAGDQHAEVAALQAAHGDARGAVVFVSLEPCNHHGRTAPCTHALIAAGVSRVVFAVADPNPHVTGRGAEALRAAGISVRQGFTPELQPEAERVIAPWRTFITQGRPHLTLKVAMTLDGRIATRTGQSRWITGPDAREDAHRLRAASDVVLVGLGTVRADDPMLNARDVGAERQPVRVVLDSGLGISLEARVVASAREVGTWVITTHAAPEARERALTERGVTVLRVGASGGKVSLPEALAALAARGVVTVMCEGGGTLHGALLAGAQVDRLVCYVAPMILGGNDAHPAFGAAGGAATLAEAFKLHDVRTRRVGADLRIEAEVLRGVHGDHPDGR